MTQQPLEAYIGEGLTLKGSVSGDTDMDIDGRVEGTISVSGHVRVLERGQVIGPLTVGSLTALGRVTGDVVATRALHVGETGRVTGDVRAARVSLDDGGLLDGAIDMDVALPAGLLEAP
ncbi:MAG: polymer-forming cytoskeletal protein [Myxococcales bacterium]|nr:polymer-forming cytoskeletal protein [Myxococcales bacterium]MCB9627497.1 polymer-forming cytoskeletal protein [Sandaracinaceae bacterium]